MLMAHPFSSNPGETSPPPPTQREQSQPRVERAKGSKRGISPLPLSPGHSWVGTRLRWALLLVKGVLRLVGSWGPLSLDTSTP